MLLASLEGTYAATRDGLWTTDVEEAGTAARKDHKSIFLFFTGSDWCAPCILLEKEVLHTREFEDYADERLVLVVLDFPLDEELISAEQTAHNEQWREHFGVGGYPTVLLTDASLSPYAQTGYRSGGPGLYIEHLEVLGTVPETLQDIMRKADAEKGLKRAVWLDTALNLEGAIVDRRALEDEIVALLQSQQHGQEELRSKYIPDGQDEELREELTALYGRELSPANKIDALGELIGKHDDIRTGNAINEAANTVARLAISAGEAEKDRAIAILDRLINADGFTSHLEQNFIVAKAAILAAKGDLEGATTQIEIVVRMAPEQEAYRETLMQHINRTAEHFADK
ncbi:MAG: thioredoxin family protein [Gammaproteobacteria bacterium]|nr:thioredoxin family protein [Gammaproteobacteria bacterium]